MEIDILRWHWERVIFIHGFRSLSSYEAIIGLDEWERIGQESEYLVFARTTHDMIHHTIFFFVLNLNSTSIVCDWMLLIESEHFLIKCIFNGDNDTNKNTNKIIWTNPNK